MRFQVFVMVTLLFVLIPIQAQEHEYPTLDALAELEIPEYDHAEFTSRFEELDISITPPSSPPEYGVGDRETFFVRLTGPRESAEFELRGMTETCCYGCTSRSVIRSRRRSRWRTGSRRKSCSGLKNSWITNSRQALTAIRA